MKTTKGNFADALRQADKKMSAHGVPEASARRIRRRLAEPPRNSWYAVLVGTAALAALVLFWLLPTDKGDKAIASVAGFQLANPSADLRYQQSHDGRLTIEQGHCELLHPTLGVRVASSGPVQLFQDKSGIRVLEGVARFHVDKRRQAEQVVRIFVSYGTIEVIGTDFTVTQREAGGTVVLHEGAIRFVSEAGEVRTLAVNESLSWPLPVAKPASTSGIPSAVTVGEKPVPTADKVKDEAGVKGASKKKNALRENALREKEANEEQVEKPVQPTDGDLLAELAKLRSRRQYARAATRLREALKDKATRATLREQLSYELGTILSNQLSDASAACQHWEQHRERYVDGRYEFEAQSAENRLDCE